MKKVLFKKWIPKQQGVIGTGCFEVEYTHKGVFHQWGCAYDEYETNIGNYTVGIVELPNGEITVVLPIHIKFIND